MKKLFFLIFQIRNVQLSFWSSLRRDFTSMQLHAEFSSNGNSRISENLYRTKIKMHEEDLTRHWKIQRGKKIKNYKLKTYTKVCKIWRPQSGWRPKNPKVHQLFIKINLGFYLLTRFHVNGFSPQITLSCKKKEISSGFKIGRINNSKYECFL